MGFYDGSAVKNLPLMQETEETWFRSLSQQDPLEEEMETHFSIFAWKIPWSKESGGLQSMESQRVGHYWVSMHGETMETVTDFIFLGSKITADGDCRHEIKRHLLLGRKAMTNLESILKSRDITLLTKIHIVKATVFPVVMYGCESWTVKKAERSRIDAFEPWCWRRLLRVLWTARRSNQSILTESNP